MNMLAFEREATMENGRRIRRVKFERRSALPVSAACVVANGVRETLGAVLAAPVSLRLLEPLIPDAQGWHAICAQARMYAVRGNVADAAFILRPRDALALAAAAFGETPGDLRALSPVEQEVTLRALRAVGASQAPVCGREMSALEPILDINGYVTYFELLMEQPVPMRLGVALSRDPAQRGAGTLRAADLLDVEIELSVEFARGTMSAARFLGLGSGENVPMNTKVGEPALLKTAGTVLARGECGALGERSVMIVKD
jgi:flagellar motor switch/type III secretory pathway protein FliN